MTDVKAIAAPLSRQSWADTITILRQLYNQSEMNLKEFLLQKSMMLTPSVQTVEQVDIVLEAIALETKTFYRLIA